MKVYIRAANISDIQAKIAKKQDDIDKKDALINKREAAIAKKLDLLKDKISDEDYNDLVDYLELLRNYNSYRLPEHKDVNTWAFVRKYGFSYDDKPGKALYSIDEDAKSIYNAKQAIKEYEETLAKYEEKLAKEKQKDSEIDEIPECLKEFMNSIIDKWDAYDLRIKHEGKPYYSELYQAAWKILYGDNSYGIPSQEQAKLAELYPNIENRGYRDLRRKQFDYDYIDNPFEKEYGSLNYARSIWGLTDEKIHDLNVQAGKQLILDLLKRVTKITGPVTNWTGLHVATGNGGFAVLNGLVIGEDGKAEVESIYAGGYSVQRLHIRTLVKPVR